MQKRLTHTWSARIWSFEDETGMLEGKTGARGWVEVALAFGTRSRGGCLWGSVDGLVIDEHNLEDFEFEACFDLNADPVPAHFSPRTNVK
jgi:hypothetical protein